MSAASNSDYYYNASVGAAALFAAIYGILMVAHFGQAIRYRTWFMVVLLICVTMETVGYITRIISIKSPGPDWSVIVSQVMLITSPAFFAAQSYMIVGHIMAYVGGEYAFIKHTMITKVFVASDVFAILTQAGGGAMLAGNNQTLSRLQTARKMLLIGLSIQVISFGIFSFVAISYNFKTRKAPALAPFQHQMKRIRPLWVAFYITSFLITLRSIYRTIEFAEISFTPGESNPGGYLITHEWPMYVFDSIPVMIAITSFAVFHPGRYLPRKKGLRIDGTIEELPGGFLCFGGRSKNPSASTSQDMVGSNATSLRPMV